jgi:hypothetical protein
MEMGTYGTEVVRYGGGVPIDGARHCYMPFIGTAGPARPPRVRKCVSPTHRGHKSDAEYRIFFSSNILFMYHLLLK